MDYKYCTNSIITLRDFYLIKQGSFKRIFFQGKYERRLVEKNVAQSFK